MTFTEDLFVTDRDRITCSGGTAPLYLMLDLMARRYGDAVAAGVSEQFILDRIRSATEKQHIPMAARIGVNRRELLSTAQLMEAHIEDPLSFDQIAESVGLSQRQLQRMFKEYLNISPTRYYLWLRRARELLLQTDMSVMSVTVACGFQSPCHFSSIPFAVRPSAEQRTPARGPDAARAGVGSARRGHAASSAPCGSITNFRGAPASNSAYPWAHRPGKSASRPPRRRSAGGPRGWPASAHGCTS